MYRVGSDGSELAAAKDLPVQLLGVQRRIPVRTVDVGANYFEVLPGYGEVRHLP